jgi:hypothetical protein
LWYNNNSIVLFSGRPSSAEVEAALKAIEGAATVEAKGSGGYEVESVLGLISGPRSLQRSSKADGDKNPQGSSYYVQEEGDENVYLLYASTIDDLKRLVTEPPKKPTPTPTLTPTPGITVTVTATATPAMTPGP